MCFDHCEMSTAAAPDPRFRDQLAEEPHRARDLLTAPHPRTDINPYWRVDMLAAALDAAEARGAAEVEACVQAAANQRAVEELDAMADDLDTRAVELWNAYKSGPLNDPRRASPHTEGESDGWENAATRLRARAAALAGGAE